MLTRDQILQAPDFTIESVDVPEWGGSVHIRTLTARQRDRFETEFARDRGNQTRARLAAYSACDESGTPLFSEADIPALGERSARALDRLFGPILRLNKLTERDIEELAGN